MIKQCCSRILLITVVSLFSVVLAYAAPNSKEMTVAQANTNVKALIKQLQHKTGDTLSIQDPVSGKTIAVSKKALIRQLQSMQQSLATAIQAGKGSESLDSFEQSQSTNAASGQGDTGAFNGLSTLLTNGSIASSNG